MALQGKSKGAAYFSRFCAPTHNKLTLGHAGHILKLLWTPPGASLSGPEVIHQLLMRSFWYFNGKRHWKGGFPGKSRGGPELRSARKTRSMTRMIYARLEGKWELTQVR